MHGITLSQEGTLKILQDIFLFTAQYLDGFFRGEGYLVGTKERFRLNKDIWTICPHTNGVCTTTKCEGSMVKTTFTEARNKDRYYKAVYQEDALPLDIQEHTAQLSSKRAREIQADFIKGNVNVLSCTTTFELGVDVGDLRAVFMRNIPPTTANYTQRAGRVGRRAGKPGYAITFARLRPHDIAHFNDPAKIIAGETRVPMCYLDNAAIAVRHVFAVAMSEFFRYAHEVLNKDFSHDYNDFMDLSSAEPNGLKELQSYLASRPNILR